MDAEPTETEPTKTEPTKTEPTEEEFQRARLLVKAMSVALGGLAISGDPDDRRGLWARFYARRADLDQLLPGFAPASRATEPAADPEVRNDHAAGTIE